MSTGLVSNISSGFTKNKKVRHPHCKIISCMVSIHAMLKSIIMEEKIFKNLKKVYFLKLISYSNV